MDRINKGVELMLRSRRKPPKSKPIHIKIGKVVTFFRKQVTIYFEFSLNIMNPKVKEHLNGTNNSNISI